MKIKLTVGLAVSIILFGIFSFSNDDESFQIVKHLEIYQSLLTNINDHYVDETNTNTLFKTGVDGMLKTLDPYTTFIPEDEIENHRTNTSGEYGGIGIYSDFIEEKHIVLDIYRDSPAEKSNLKIGDEISSVDNISLLGKSNLEVAQLMRGQTGTEMELGVINGKSKLKKITLTREKIKLPSVSLHTIFEDSTGYIRLDEFRSTASEEVEKALVELKEKGANKLLLDLRSNPGGLLTEAVEICNFFIEKNELVVEAKGRATKKTRKYITKNEAIDLDIPIVVLMDKKSASASEIVAGVMQDYDRAVVIGTGSFGKGLVQKLNNSLPYNAQIKVTTSKYYIPSGRCIQAVDYGKKKKAKADSLRKPFYTKNKREVFDGGGITPDIKIKPKQMSSYAKNLVSNYWIFRYVNQFYLQNNEIDNPNNFKLSEAQYAAFVKWYGKQQDDNKSDSEQILDQILKLSIQDSVYQEIAQNIESINALVRSNKSNKLLSFKAEISRLIEKEIVRRSKSSLNNQITFLEKDTLVVLGKKILNDKDRYLSTLNNEK